ncbi:unnamed protein product [Cuscuta europaea]|uniref:Uncharacterized protein n=1 Tax=Cuscuta europaea TaxID=41803 RepID=A0A9P0ZPF5_CUSEU|nr:unnamed protein product [Cuscuta europaea]
MAQASATSTPKRYALVTGANKGIGFEVCRQLASSGIFVLLTARDEKRGLEAVQKLKDCGISDDLLGFHQLDVVDPHSVASLAEFVKAQYGKLDILFVPLGWFKFTRERPENHLSEERVDEVGKQFLKDFREGLLETKGWPLQVSAYIVAKACMNAYTRILAKTHPSFRVNAISPGFCKTDITNNLGPLTAAQGAEYVVRLALLPKDGPSGCFFNMTKELPSF